jgi:hypothetical protein
MNLKKKIYLYANSTTQRCPKEIMKIFLIEDFFHLPPVSTTLVVHLEMRISSRVFEKIRNGPRVSILIKIFLQVQVQQFDNCSHCLPPVSLIHLDLRISPRIFGKIRNGPNGILWGWGEAD